MHPGWLFANREAQLPEAGFRQAENAVVVANAVCQALEIVLDAGHGVGQGIQLLPVWNLFAPKQHIGDVTLGRGQHVGHALQRNQRQTATDAVQQSRDMLDFTGLPLGRDEVDDRGFDLLKGVARFTQQGAAGFAQFMGAQIDGVGLVALAAARAAFAVKPGQAGLDV